MVDSGAWCTVIGPEIAQDYPLKETEASRKGLSFISASGDPMPNHGERTLVIKTPGGSLKTMRSQVTPCTGSLTSIAQMVDADNFVGFSKRGSFILNLNTGELEMMERVDDTFELELEVVPYAEAKPMLEKQPGFQRQP